MEDWLKLAKRYDVKLSSLGLVLPQQDQKLLDAKIAGSLQEVNRMIQAARNRGKDVIFLPGSYDLLHVGHLSYLDQVIRFYIKQASAIGRKLKRDNLFIVMLADDDDLIELIKARKNIKNGGTETFHRPIERHVSGEIRHIRLDTLASLPVDCVGFMPSPLTKNLPLPQPIDSVLLRKLFANFNPKEQEIYDMVLDAYKGFNNMIENPACLINPQYAAAWQLYVMLQISHPRDRALIEEPKAFTGSNITRVVSLHDANYLGLVRAISRWSAIAVAVIDDKQIVSTTELLKDYSPAELIKHKHDETSVSKSPPR